MVSSGGKKFGGLTLDEVIALAVGVPTVILAAVAVEYARRNDAFQRMTLFMRHGRAGGGGGGHNANHEERRGGYHGQYGARIEEYDAGHMGYRGGYY